MDCVPAYWEYAGRFSPSCDTEADGADSIAAERLWCMDIPSPVGGDGRGSYARGGDLRHPSPEHFREIYCDKAHYVHVSSGDAAPRGAVFEAVLGSGRTQSGGDIGCDAGEGFRDGIWLEGGRGVGGRYRDIKIRQ